MREYSNANGGGALTNSMLGVYVQSSIFNACSGSISKEKIEGQNCVTSLDRWAIHPVEQSLCEVHCRAFLPGTSPVLF